MKLEWSVLALADLDRFATFLQDKHPQLAKIVGAEISAKAHVLSMHPRLGRPIPGRSEQYEIVLQVLNGPMCFAMDMTASGWASCACSMAVKHVSDVGVKAPPHGDDRQAKDLVVL